MLSDEEKKAIKKVKYICDKWYDENLEIDVKWLESLLSLCEKQSKEIEELKAENKEIREWKYVIDNPIDLKKLSELDLIKIFGKSYISEDKIKAKIIEIKNRPVKDEFITASQGKLNTIIDMQSLLDKE